MIVIQYCQSGWLNVHNSHNGLLNISMIVIIVCFLKLYSICLLLRILSSIGIINRELLFIIRLKKNKDFLHLKF
jgi:hypothetical protein